MRMTDVIPLTEISRQLDGKILPDIWDKVKHDMSETCQLFYGSKCNLAHTFLVHKQ